MAVAWPLCPALILPFPLGGSPSPRPLGEKGNFVSPHTNGILRPKSNLQVDSLRQVWHTLRCTSAPPPAISRASATTTTTTMDETTMPMEYEPVVSTDGRTFPDGMILPEEPTTTNQCSKTPLAAPGPPPATSRAVLEHEPPSFQNTRLVRRFYPEATKEELDYSPFLPLEDLCKPPKES
jgi:hypothetical protein